MKKLQKQQNKALYKPSLSTKSIGVIVMLSFFSLFLMSFVSSAWSSSLDNGLMAYYDFDNTTATQTDLIDYLSIYNGTLENMEAGDWVTGKIGNALYFDGVNEFVQLGNHGYKPVNYTISFWLEPDDHLGVQSPVRSGDAGGDVTAWGINLRDAGDNIEVVVSTGAVAQIGIVGTTWNNNSFPDNSWTHLIVMVNGTHLSYWTNGSFSGRIAQTQAQGGASKNISIARAGELNALYYDGKIDELGIWNKSLSDSEISDLWNSGNGQQPTTGGITITLNSPEDNFETINKEIFFNVTATSSNEIETLKFYLDGSLNETFPIPSYTYQKDANSIDCFGDWDSAHPCSNTYDGNWGSPGRTVTTFNQDAYVYFNFTKINNSTSSSLWQVGDIMGRFNLSLTDCWDAYGDKIIFKAHSHSATASGSHYNITWDCYNGTDWTNLRTRSAPASDNHYNYENAMWWRNDRTSTTETWIKTIPYGNYNWNVEACTSTTCTNSSIYSFEIFEYLIEHNQVFNNETYETASETFIINLSYDNTKWIDVSALLNYNGTTYTGTKSGSGSLINFTRILNIPLVNTQENVTFYWTFALSNTTGTYYYNSTSNNQTINDIVIGLCNATLNVQVLNFTAYNEENLTRIKPFTFYGTFTFWMGTGEVNHTLSVSNQSLDEVLICVNANETFYSDAILQYEKTGFIKRSYYLINETLTNVSQDKNLFLLDTTMSTSFIIDVMDNVQIGISNAYIYIQRYYPGTNQYETVEMAKTDSGGSTVGHFEAETEDYRIIIEKGGLIVFQSGTQKIFCRETPCTLTFQIEAGAGITWEEFGIIDEFEWTLIYNEATKTWTFTYVDHSGSIGYGRLYVYYERPDTGKVTICNVSSSLLADALTCDVTGQEGTIYAVVYLSRSPEILIYLKSIVIKAFKQIFQLEGLFLMMFVLLVLGLAGLWNPAVGIILTLGGLIIINIIGIASFGLVTIWGLIIIGMILLWELKT